MTVILTMVLFLSQTEGTSRLENQCHRARLVWSHTDRLTISRTIVVPFTKMHTSRRHIGGVEGHVPTSHRFYKKLAFESI